MKLFTNEEKLISSNEDKIILTNYRLLISEKEWGGTYEKSIFLEHICAIEINFISNKIFLFLAVLFVVLSLSAFSVSSFYNTVDSAGPQFIIPLIVAILFFVIWWFSRKHIISTKSNGNVSIDFSVKGMKKESIDNFVNKVSEAKILRIKAISNNI